MRSGRFFSYMHYSAINSTVGKEKISVTHSQTEVTYLTSLWAAWALPCWNQLRRRRPQTPPIFDFQEFKEIDQEREREANRSLFKTHFLFLSNFLQKWLQEPHQTINTKKWWLLLLLPHHFLIPLSSDKLLIRWRSLLQDCKSFNLQ